MISLVLPKVARARLRTHPSPSHQAKQKLLQGLRLRPGVAGQKRLKPGPQITQDLSPFAQPLSTVSQPKSA